MIAPSYDDLSLEDLIILYAEDVADGDGGTRRIRIHDALCKKLGVKHWEFRPFEAIDMASFLTPEMGEWFIRKAIAELKESGRIK
jgi:hypothetical protein